MGKRIFSFCLIVICLLMAGQVFADSEAPAEAYVKGSETPPYPAYQRGRIYARCIPGDFLSGSESGAKTYIYEVAKEGDKLLYSYDWYDEVFLFDDHYSYEPFLSIVRVGPHHPRGHVPREDQLAIAFYKDGKELSKYSALDIVRLCHKDPDSVPKSVGHYSLIESIEGFKEIGRDDIFDIKAYDGQILSFDIRTGKVVTKEEIDERKKDWEYYEGECNRVGHVGDQLIRETNQAGESVWACMTDKGRVVLQPRK